MAQELNTYISLDNQTDKRAEVILTEMIMNHFNESKIINENGVKLFIDRDIFFSNEIDLLVALSKTIFHVVIKVVQKNNDILDEVLFYIQNGKMYQGDITYTRTESPFDASKLHD